MFNSLVAKIGEEPGYKTLPYYPDQDRESKSRKAGDIFDDDYYGALLEILGGGPVDLKLDPAVKEALETQKSQMEHGISGTFVPVESNYGGIKY